MRIAELSARTGASVATLKYYLREGLLPPGDARAVNQAEYGDLHVRRVRLIRALQDVGGLALHDIRRVLDAVDDDGVDVHAAFGIAQDAMVPARDRSSELHARAKVAVDDFVGRHRLRVRPEAAARWMLADALVAMHAMGHEISTAPIEGRVAQAVADAEQELAFVPASDRVAQMETVVVGTVAVEQALAALRRLALEHASARRFRPRRPRRVPTT